MRADGQACGFDWIEVARGPDIVEGADGHVVTLDGVRIAIFRVSGELFAIGDECPHQRTGKLSEGWLDGTVIECPLHQACFDLRTGRNVAPPDCASARIYPVRAEDDRVLLSTAPHPAQG